MPRRVNETEATPRSVLPGKFLSANGFAGNGVVVIIGYEAAIFIAHENRRLSAYACCAGGSLDALSPSKLKATN
jgi:hypothetical protein